VIGDVSKAQLEISALQMEIQTLKKQIDENARAVAMDDDYRCVCVCF
jgi:hypothetical protein